MHVFSHSNYSSSQAQTKSSKHAALASFICSLNYLASTELVWATPQVYQLLDKAGATEDSIVLTDTVNTQLREWLKHNPESGHQLPLQQLQESLNVEMLNLIDGKEYLLRLTNPPKPADDTQSLKQQFSVTGREADVLLWIANGKTNREIGQILEMSPRTVNKHLEQIFKKLGVENRTSAAAVAIKCLARG